MRCSFPEDAQGKPTPGTPNGVIAILDIDGTLVDSNYQHAIAWFRAMRDHGLVVPIWKLHRAIGMGGDQMVAYTVDQDAEDRLGDKIREAEGEHYQAMIAEVQPLDGARELVLALKQRGHTVIMASSAKPEELDHYLDLLAARTLADDWTGAGDVEETKPAPDLIDAALKKVDGRKEDAVMIGDSVWDVEAAANAGVDTYAVMTGGFSEAELADAGAKAVFGSVKELVDRLSETALGEPA